MLLASIAALVFFLLPGQTPDPENEARAPEPAALQSPPPEPEPKREVLEGNIKPGDTITSLLGGYFSPQEIHALSGQSRKVFPLSGICAGQPFKICTVDGTFDSFEYDIDRDQQLIIRKAEEGYDIQKIPIEYAVKTDLVRGTITSSLFEAVSQSGESAELAMALADIFAWDVDFIRDIRQGDSFQALVEKRFREGAPAGYGKILAAEFTNQGSTFRAFLYKDGDRSASYFDADGNNVRKAFLKAPLSFTRISSGFTQKRFHPITKTWKAHPAIDYAAPTGTPIKSVGDGTIIKIGYTKYNGNFIKLRHNSSYETLYLHMSKFAKGMKQGKRIEQGQVIGYVGSTGLATGPHLCFRMYKNGSPVNPYKVKSPASAPIARERLPQYKEAIAALIDKLETGQLQHAKVADSSDASSQSN
ncbi:peptidase M24 [Desulfuromonas versatilis]|uniref:Peptidase M24 n=1 Tax=Desulfuromonas versatilis TaxID=2802975 RepID=A0ABM8HV43_9BACT|nr:peptidase M24 [Desulfuromonas versatilis]